MKKYLTTTRTVLSYQITLKIIESKKKNYDKLISNGTILEHLVLILMVRQLINHGVPEEVIEKTKIDIEEFFELPLDQKKAYAQLPNSIEGYGQAFVLSEEQKLDWGDMFFLNARPVAVRDMRFWPTHPTSFR